MKKVFHELHMEKKNFKWWPSYTNAWMYAMKTIFMDGNFFIDDTVKCLLINNSFVRAVLDSIKLFDFVN